MSARRDELAGNLAAVERRIQRACDAAGRDRSEVQLIVVTKTYPVSDVDLLAELGVTEVGENRHPEARDKKAASAYELVWHYVGGLQSNKAHQVAAYADLVHSVDRVKLVSGLSRGAQGAEHEVGCLVQVALSDDDHRSGVAPDGVAEVADAVAQAPGLVLRGVMAVAPLGVDPVGPLERLAEVSADLRRDHPDATLISAGMSQDLEQAVAAGATHLRVGRSVLGERPPTR